MRSSLLALLSLCSLWVLACENKASDSGDAGLENDTSGDTDIDSDTDVDADSDTDADTDTDSDAETDHGTDTAQETDSGGDAGTDTDMTDAGSETDTDENDSGDGTDSDDESDSGDGTDSDGETDTTQSGCAFDAETFAFSLDSSGGFSGDGEGRYSYSSGVLTATAPREAPCEVALNAQERETLLDAAAAVDWDGVTSDYTSPDNPDCCCDQFIYDLTISQPGCPKSVHFCSDSFTLDLMPDDFEAFVDTVREMGRDAAGAC
jgi:hypothetical protein